MKFKVKYLSVIGIIIFIWLLLNINFNQLISIFEKINPWFLIPAFIFFILSLIINFLRWGYIVNCLGINLTKIDTIKLSFKSLFAENTPGRVGEPILKAVYLREHTKGNVSNSLFSTVFHKFIDVWSAVIQAVLVVIILFLLFKINLIILIPSIIIFLLIIASLFVLVYNRKLSVSIVKPFFRLLIPNKNKEKIKKNLNDFYDNFKKINKKILFVCFLYDLIEVIVTGICLYFIVLSLNQNLPLIHAILVIPLLTIGTGLPLSISGLGIRESILIFYFGLLKIAPEIGIAAGLVLLLIKLLSLIPGLIIGLVE